MRNTPSVKIIYKENFANGPDMIDLQLPTHFSIYRGDDFLIRRIEGVVDVAG